MHRLAPILIPIITISHDQLNVIRGVEPFPDALENSGFEVMDVG